MIIPEGQPQLSESRVLEILKGRNNLLLNVKNLRCCILAIRGYYRNMGEPNVNDCGLYDDAAFLVVGERVAARVNWNCDASKLGWNPNLGKPYAQLCTGTWNFIRGWHKNIRGCFRQATDDIAEKLRIPNAGEFKVSRIFAKGDRRNYVEQGYFAINMHPGGVETTSSWGCQTSPPEQFRELQRRAYSAMEVYRMDVIEYMLIDDNLCLS